MNPADWSLLAELEGMAVADYVFNYFDEILAAGAGPNDIVSAISPYPWHLVNRYHDLVDAGAYIDMSSIVERLEPYHKAMHIEIIQSAGIGVNLKQLLEELTPEDTADFAVGLVKTGAQIDVKQLVAKLSPFDQVLALDGLNAIGADIDVRSLVPRLDPLEISVCSEELHAAGIDVPAVLRERGVRDIDLVLPVYDAAAVRTWAREHGYQVRDQGRLPRNILDAYLSSTDSQELAS